MQTDIIACSKIWPSPAQSIARCMLLIWAALEIENKRACRINFLPLRQTSKLLQTTKGGNIVSRRCFRKAFQKQHESCKQKHSAPKQRLSKANQSKQYSNAELSREKKRQAPKRPITLCCLVTITWKCSRRGFGFPSNSKQIMEKTSLRATKN